MSQVFGFFWYHSRADALTQVIDLALFIGWFVLISEVSLVESSMVHIWMKQCKFSTEFKYICTMIFWIWKEQARYFWEVINTDIGNLLQWI